MNDLSLRREDESGATSFTLPRLRIAPLLIACVGCVRHLPPAPVPAPVAPPVASASAATPTASGRGRLVVDVVDGPTPVQRIRMAPQQVDTGRGSIAYRFSETADVLCPASPCVADVPTGNLLLGFPVLGDSTDIETELVHVGPETSVYRRALSVYTDRTGATRVLGIIATSVGAASMITGTALLPVGLSRDNDGLATAGGISLGAGVVMVVLGILAIRADSPTYRAGSSNHFPVP